MASYRRYNKEAVDNVCGIEGGPEKWDALVANMSHGEHIKLFKFSLDSALFVSCSEEYVYLGTQGKLKIWDTVAGTPISMIPGHRFAVANDVSKVASSEDKTITFYDVNGSPSSTIITTSSKIDKLALSSESSRVAAGLADGTVWLWESNNAELIACFDGFDGSEYSYPLEFSPNGTRLACSSVNGIKLRDGISGRFIADLRCGSSLKFAFSGDGSRIASLSYDDSLTLWNSVSGGLIGAARNVRMQFAISTNGSLLAAAGPWNNVTLWNENRGHLVKIKDLELERSPLPMAFSLDNILAIRTTSDLKLYNVKTHSFIHILPLGGTPVAFSPDGTRLAFGDSMGNLNLWDVRGIDASSPPSKGNAAAVTALALSQDCSRLACGFDDGTVELWGPSPTMRRIDSLALRSKMKANFYHIFRRSRHTKSVRALGFNPDGKLFVSGSDDGTIKLWNGGDGVLRGTLKAPSNVRAVALSNSVLVATWGKWDNSGVTLWSLDTLSPFHTPFKRYEEPFKVSIAENSTLIAIFVRTHVTVLDVVNRTKIATFDVPSDIHTMTFLPNNSQLVVQCDEGVFLSLNLVNKRIMKEPTLERLIQLPNTPLWYGIPVWHCKDKDSMQHYFAALFSQHKDPVPLLWIPREIPVTAWTQGSSKIAFGCEDGRVILLIRLPTSHVT